MFVILAGLQCEKKKQGEEERKEKERLMEQEQDKSVSYMDHLGKYCLKTDRILN